MDNLNCKMQAHTRMCEENEELEENNCLLSNYVERLIVRAFQETLKKQILVCLHMLLHSIKVLSIILYLIYQ